VRRDVAADENHPPARPKTVSRRVDRAGRISILKHRYHIGRHLAGEAVTIESADGLLHVSHNGMVVATHARRHLIDDDDKMDRRANRTKPALPTTGGEVLPIVDRSGGVSFAGTGYRGGSKLVVLSQPSNRRRRGRCRNSPRPNRFSVLEHDNRRHHSEDEDFG
jgi:hypothetical protein